MSHGRPKRQREGDLVISEPTPISLGGLYDIPVNSAMSHPQRSEKPQTFQIKNASPASSRQTRPTSHMRTHRWVSKTSSDVQKGRIPSSNHFLISRERDSGRGEGERESGDGTRDMDGCEGRAEQGESADGRKEGDREVEEGEWGEEEEWGEGGVEEEWECVCDVIYEMEVEMEACRRQSEEVTRHLLYNLDYTLRWTSYTHSTLSLSSTLMI